MREHKLHLPAEAAAFWRAEVETVLPRAEIILCWDGSVSYQYRLGVLATGLSALKTSLQWLGATPFKSKENQPKPPKQQPTDMCRPAPAERRGARIEDWIGQSLTRAGWQRPRMASEQWQQLVSRRARDGSRLEFILDTNALVNGTAIWLAELFADSCDLRLTALSSEEIQDFYSRAGWGASASEDAIKARHAYLSAQRFREFSGLSRVLWLPVDLLSDETLQLASGSQQGKKSCGADSAILRASHRLIQDRVNGLERFFVCGDGPLARRAAVELPPGSVILSRTRDAESERYYSPCRWWPGPDEGRALLFPSCVRLIWELSALCDWIELRPVDGIGSTIYKLRSFQREMWISDHTNPWLVVSVEPVQAVAQSATAQPSVKDQAVGLSPPSMDSVASTPSAEVEMGTPVSTVGSKMPAGIVAQPLGKAELESNASAGGQRIPRSMATVNERGDSHRPVTELQPVFALELSPASSMSPTSDAHQVTLAARLFEREEPVSVPEHLRVDSNFRFDTDRLLDLLHLVAVADPERELRVPDWLRKTNSELVGYLCRLLRGLRLVELLPNGTRFKLLGDAATLKAIWLSGDIEQLALFMRRYVAFSEQLEYEQDKLPSHPPRTIQSARMLAGRLGQVAWVERTAYRGSANPTMAEVRSAIFSQFDREPTIDRTYSVYQLFVDVFLRKLRVSPVRAMSAWVRMEMAGVFQDIEFRTGGTADASKCQEVIEIGAVGWKVRRVLLEEFRGKRDLVDRRKHHG